MSKYLLWYCERDRVEMRNHMPILIIYILEKITEKIVVKAGFI